MGAALGHDPGNFYVWRAADDFAIHLSLPAVTQLNAQISRSGSGTPDLRGVLLGRTVNEPFRATVIEDFQPARSGDDRAATDDPGDALLEKALQKARGEGNRQVVGFFRSRCDGRLNLGPRDMETFRRLFRETGNVALLIQTARRADERDAALFYSDRNGVQPTDFGFGFPFDSAQLASGHPGWRYPDPIEHSPEPPKNELDWTRLVAPPPPRPQWTPPPPPLPRSKGEPIRWSRLAPTVVIAGLAIGTLQLLSNSRHTVAAAPPAGETASVPARPAAPAVPNDQGALGLQVNSLPRQLEIRWNRASPALAASEGGVMKITENGITESVPFDQAQLRDGYVSYTPKTNDVSVRLEVTDKNGTTTSESIRAVAIP